MDAQKKELTREEKIAMLEAELAPHESRLQEFEKQLRLLIAGKQKNAVLADRQVIDELKGLPPNISPEFTRDKVLQIPLRSDLQLDANIRKVQVALQHETGIVRKIRGQIKAIENEIFEEKITKIINEVFIGFDTWLKSYRNSRDIFYNNLCPKILEAFDLDPKFFQRAEKMGLNKSVVVSIQSHFRNDQTVNMEETVEKILNLSDAYTPGKPLLEKTQISGTWPDNPESFFGYENRMF